MTSATNRRDARTYEETDWNSSQLHHRTNRSTASLKEELKVEVLTERERAVIPLIAQGRTNREIAMRLGVQEAWIKILVSRLLKKCNLPNRAAVAAQASKLLQHRVVGESLSVDDLRNLVRSSPLRFLTGVTALATGPMEPVQTSVEAS